jgi:hypothetical protein
VSRAGAGTRVSAGTTRSQGPVAAALGREGGWGFVDMVETRVEREGCVWQCLAVAQNGIYR